MTDSNDTGPVTLLGATRIRQLAEELGIKPTKTLGQNFVHDGNTVRRIISQAELRPDDHVLEIGPGLGSLTLGLLDVAAAVTVVEIDQRLAARLPQTVSEQAPQLADKLRVITADAMSVRAADLPENPTALVANLPYNVSVPVLLHLLSELPSIRRVLVMVQAEVADRLAAGPGSKTYGSPSVKASWYGVTKRAGAIGRNVFWPAPNVDSALVAIDRHEVPTEGDRTRVFSVVDAAFAQRRKTLRAALAGWAGSPVQAEAVLRRAGVDPSARGETLDFVQFRAIAQAAEAIATGAISTDASAADVADVANAQDVSP